MQSCSRRVSSSMSPRSRRTVPQGIFGGNGERRSHRKTQSSRPSRASVARRGFDALTRETKPDTDNEAMATVSQVRGALLEEAVLFLLQKIGYEVFDHRTL